MPNVNVRCPFHKERLGREDRTPSCGVDIELDVYGCFGCGASGKASKYPSLIAEARRLELDLVTTAPAPTEFMLPSNLTGYAKEFLLNRGFISDVLLRFEVSGDTDMVYLPLRLRSDEVVGVIHRMLFGETRYVYSKGFQRRNFLYGSRQFKADNDKVFLVEGSLDCIRMHQLGFTNTVASMGTKVSPTQRSLLKRLGSEVILAFDNDPAGVVASKEQSQLLLREGYRVGHLRYPQGDPGDIESPTDVEEISCVEYALTY